MLNRLDESTLAEIRLNTASVLRRAIGPARQVAILDVPNQRNIGDSLIWEGELAYLELLGYDIRYASDLQGYDPATLRRRLPKNGAVLLHGGGNFGDLWLGHQEHREQIIADLRDYRIIQLPQSIFFSSSARAQIANEAIRRHPDFLLLVRDSLSMARAAVELPDLRAEFCADMALGWTPTAKSGQEPERDEILLIARKDREAASGLSSVPEEWLLTHPITVTDWGLHAADPVAWRIARGVAWVNHKLLAFRRQTGFLVPALPQWAVEAALRKINRSNVTSALALYAGSRALVVDRLHAHILALLLGVDHVLLDNNYRKLGAVFDDYTGAFATARYCTDLDEARREVLDLLAD